MAPSTTAKTGDKVFLFAAVHAASFGLGFLVPYSAGKPLSWVPVNRFLFSDEAMLLLDSPTAALFVTIMSYVIMSFAYLYYRVYRDGIAAHQKVVLIAAIGKLLVFLTVAKSYVAGDAGVLPLFLAAVVIEGVLAVVYVAKLLALRNKQD